MATDIKKGDLITFDLGSSITPKYGYNNQYRVLNVNGDIVEVLAMYDIENIVFNGLADNHYFDSYLDNYLNKTWYKSLSKEGKNAIVPKMIKQNGYGWDYYKYEEEKRASFVDYSTKVNYSKTSRKRNIYALDVEDIEEYFNHTFSTADIWEMFWNVRSQPSTPTYPWLRSASAAYSNIAWFVYGRGGNVIDLTAPYTTCAARPALSIDLSKISWSKV